MKWGFRWGEVSDEVRFQMKWGFRLSDVSNEARFQMRRSFIWGEVSYEARFQMRFVPFYCQSLICGWFYKYIFLSGWKIFKYVDVDGVAERSVHSACVNGWCVVSTAGSASFGGDVPSSQYHVVVERGPPGKRIKKYQTLHRVSASESKQISLLIW